MAEHSMCQPGRPAPHGDGHDATRARRLAALPEGEVARVALAARVGVGGGLHVVARLAGELAVAGQLAVSK
jgi:hypothetical protein